MVHARRNPCNIHNIAGLFGFFAVDFELLDTCPYAHLQHDGLAVLLQRVEASLYARNERGELNTVECAAPGHERQFAHRHYKLHHRLASRDLWATFSKQQPSKSISYTLNRNALP